ncbi:hypothetical protein IFM89_033126 [Coptis chinensis]|uniref:Aluminum-activated malate transporter n=1 Tax=Coptis chinensis TaxID=261450 RepID=A0A835LKG8_9MAGN|nr:hypothetical protein IFM89_033126 [Coptis chinensis]
MEIGPESHESAGFIARGWWWIMGLLMKLVTKVRNVANKIKRLGQDDPRRIIHSVKMGLALSLISLVYYFRPTYDSFGVSAMWAVLTVVVVFEFTVGATLGKGFNRGVATFLAGALGVGAHQLASLAGQEGEPMLLGLFVFLLAATASFSRFFPEIKARYDYGVLIFILTFCLVSVSGYRVEKLIELAHQRLSTILIGSFACVFVSIFVYPVWAGEELHNHIALNMEKIADFLEGFGGEYFDTEGSVGETSLVPKKDKSFLDRYKSVLNSNTTEENLANFARWEPCHARFRFRHPWKQYLKIGGLSRQCACRLEALSSYINSEGPQEFRKNIQDECIKMSSESAKTLTELASAIRTMTRPHSAYAHLANSKAAASNLKVTLKSALSLSSDLLQVIPAVTVTSLLVEVVACTEKIAESIDELAQLAKFKTVEVPIVILENPKTLHRVTIKKSDIKCPQLVITIEEPPPSLPGNIKLSKPLEKASH